MVPDIISMPRHLNRILLSHSIYDLLLLVCFSLQASSPLLPVLFALPAVALLAATAPSVHPAVHAANTAAEPAAAQEDVP